MSCIVGASVPRSAATITLAAPEAAAAPAASACVVACPVIGARWTARDRLMAAIYDRFEFEEGAERAIEIDPRHFSKDDAQALARNGFTRASTGVQSFDPAVQRAINRIQPYEVVAEQAGLDHLMYLVGNPPLVEGL